VKNFHRDKRLVAYAADIWRNHDLSVEQAVEQILMVVDVLSFIRVTEGRLPISRSQLLRNASLTSKELDRILDPMLPFAQQRLDHTPPTSYGLVERNLSKAGARGRPSEYYTLINRGRRAGGAKPKITWDGDVLDAGYRDSLQWDIAAEIWNKPWIKETEVIRLFKGYPTVDGEGAYGVEGVRAHIEEMLVWNRLRRATEVEAHDFLDTPKGSGPVAAVLLKGDTPLNPDARTRARRWSASEHLEMLAARRADGPLATEVARNAPGRPDWTPPEPPEDENVPGEDYIPEPVAATPQSDEKAPAAPAEPEPVPEAPAAEPHVLDADGWPEDEGVPEGEEDEVESSMRSARARNRVVEENEAS
jgi:hypothetical protein